jgi:hypothetical protein
MRSLFRVPIVDAIECMVQVLSTTPRDVLLYSIVSNGRVGPGDCHALVGKERALPADSCLFKLVHRYSAPAMLCGSKASGSIFHLDDQDQLLSEGLVAAAQRNGVAIVEHVLVKDGMFRLMSETETWPHAATGIDLARRSE